MEKRELSLPIPLRRARVRPLRHGVLFELSQRLGQRLLAKVKSANHGLLSTAGCQAA